MRAPTSVQRQLGLGQTVTHKEQIATVDVLPDGNPLRKDWIINPRKSMFPWLSMIGRAYDMYMIKDLKFTYVPDCPTTAAGSMIMYIDYDPIDNNSAISYEGMMSMAGAVSDSIYRPITLRFDQRRVQAPNHSFYCEGGDTPDRFNDIGRLWMRTKGPVEIRNAGRLFVDYTIAFKDPEAPATEMPDTLYASLRSAEAAANVTAQNPMGTAAATFVTGQVNDVVRREASRLASDLLNTCTIGGAFSGATSSMATLGVPAVTHLEAYAQDEDGLPLRTPDDDWDLTLGDETDTGTYYVVFDPAEYVNATLCFAGNWLAAEGTTAPPALVIAANRGWEQATTGGAYTFMPSIMVAGGRNPYIGQISLSYHRSDPTSTVPFIFTFHLAGTGDFEASTGSRPSHTVSTLTITQQMSREDLLPSA